MKIKKLLCYLWFHDYRLAYREESQVGRYFLWQGYSCRRCSKRKTKDVSSENLAYLTTTGLQRMNNWEDYGVALTDDKLLQWIEYNKKSQDERIVEFSNGKKTTVTKNNNVVKFKVIDNEDKGES